jgi:hypothetical protein
MDAVARHTWFLGSSSLSLLQDIRKQPVNRIVAELLIIALFFAFTVKTESWLSQYVFQPLLKRLFGDNEQLRRELEQQEADLRRMLQEQRAGPPPSSRAQTQERLEDNNKDL